MKDDEKGRGPIQPPVSDKKREGVRAIVEAGVSLIPGGGPLARLYRTTHPPKSEQDRKEWQQAISDRTNEHTERLDEHERLIRPEGETLTGITAELAQRLVQDCPDGMGLRFYDLDRMCGLVPSAPRDAVEDAAHELELLGLLRMRHHLQGWHAALAPDAYEQLDGQIMGWHPEEDAVIVARQMLEQGTSLASQLHAATGWERRRFNPALRIVLRLFPEGRISQALQAEYASYGVAMLPEDRVRLRRFIGAQAEGQHE